MSQEPSHYKFFGLFLIISSLVGFGIWCRYEIQPPLNKPLNQTQNLSEKPKSALQVLWEDDIAKMYDDDLFHKKIMSLNKVRVFLLDQNLHQHFDKLRAPFKFNKKGGNLLEVSFMSHHSESDNQDRLIVQYNLINKKSGDMFWEHSRTIPLPENTLE